MRLLLDTQALLWYATADAQLSQVARDLILDAANEVLISPASYWEVAIKVSIAKLPLAQPYDDLLDVWLKQYGFVVLPILPAHTSRVATLPYPTSHRDPFDRLLVSQALVEGIPLVSADRDLDAYGIRRLW